MLNDLHDLAMHPITYCELLGYTEEELTIYFVERIQSLANKRSQSLVSLGKEIRVWCNGYHFVRDVAFG